MKSVIIYRKGSSEPDFFYNVHEDEATRLNKEWSNSVNSSKPPIFLNFIFNSDLGETSMLLSEIAGITVGNNV